MVLSAKKNKRSCFVLFTFLFVCWDIVTSCCSASSLYITKFLSCLLKARTPAVCRGFLLPVISLRLDGTIAPCKGSRSWGGERGGGSKVLWKAPQRLCSKILLASLEPCVLHRRACHGKTVNVRVQSVHLNFIVWAPVFSFWDRGATADSEMGF